MKPSTEGLAVTNWHPPITALTVQWCITHHGLLLSHEIELDRGLGRSITAWEKVRDAALEGRADDIVIARETLRAWELECMLGESELEDCADLLPSALVAVEFVWGECRHDEVPEGALRATFEVAAARREQVLAGYRPPASDLCSLWHEVHQGCARPDAMNRKRVLHRVDRAISRSPYRWMTARVELARATEFDAQRRYQEAREWLDSAVRASWPLKRIDRREPAPLALAEHLWRCGEVGDATRFLSQLRGDPAGALSQRIEGKASEREALADAERAHRRQNSVESWRALTFAHLSAGHRLVAERLAQELCTAHRDDACSWETKARVLHANARHRSTLDAADRWIDLAPDSAPARSLLARAFARVGHAGREPAAETAAAAIELCEAGQELPASELEQLAEICYRAELVDVARRADDLVWARRAEREPESKWLVAAAIRRCHGPWAEDAPTWLSRVAGLDSRALARWAAERVDSVQHWCEVIDRQMCAPFVWRRAETDLTPAARAIAREAGNLTIRDQARDVALRAAGELGYSEEIAMATLVARSPDPESDTAALPEMGSDSTANWNRHRGEIEVAFGPGIVIALRASEVAQQAWTTVRVDRATGASLATREIFQDEKLAWARWARNQPALNSAATDIPVHERLGLLHELARCTDDEIRRTEWSTRWDDLDRW